MTTKTPFRSHTNYVFAWMHISLKLALKRGGKYKCLYSKPKLIWRQLRGKLSEDIIGEFIDEEMEHYLRKLYIHDGIMPIT